ncbi:UvrD-helicase domain-containing protein [Xylella taiwanensis]|uniref:RecBCD enzyme subunit RecB n=1 Tax=Xylella taiwanensis TaxID=1444770 RepID=A0ABS8TTU5_9GAMM|nr:exodeoxyribonuclease V subunit beta [Xylella taiwanensis]MCD8472486.1 UvrD-helicase domain-containing protein [Xylella taiwanensis]
MSAAPDPYLTLPLQGVRLIEASAGTGKTFTMATLVTRLIVERGLRIGHILAVTFTDAATQELRIRIRERLVLAARLVPHAAAGLVTVASQQPQVPDGRVDAPAQHVTRVTPVVAGLASPEAPDVALSLHILRTYLAASDETPETLRWRLQQAADEIDLAAIFTIHGFCARVLCEHALEAGQSFTPPTLLASDRDLLHELATDLWRQGMADAEAVDDLIHLWPGGAEMLAQDLGDLLYQPRLYPVPSQENAVGMGDAALATAEATLRHVWQAHGAALRIALHTALEDGVLSKTSYKPDALNELSDWLERWTVAPETCPVPHPKLETLTAAALQAGTRKHSAGRLPISPVSGAVERYLDALVSVDVARAQRRLRRLHLLRAEARVRLTALKRQRRVQTYDDLIEGVAQALDGVYGLTLVRRLREQYRIALVDEFQDTDITQWRIFHHVFGDAALVHTAGLTPALFLIGDPKQAIYGFRGGDVHTYLAAAARAERAPPLERNFRSRPVLLRAIQALYAQGGEDAFLTPGIAFHPVQPGTQCSAADLSHAGVDAPALVVWQAPPPLDSTARGKPKPWSAEAARTLCTDACVHAIYRWLADAQTGRAMLEGRPVCAGDIAVLVRNHREAALLQQALARAGIPAVAAGKHSLFTTDEANETLAVLLAVLHSADEGRLRAALSTVLLGLTATTIAAFDHDSVAYRHWQLQALRWRERVQSAGPLGLLSDLCAAHAERLLGLFDGERRLSNYLQLGELLQQAHRRALGLHGLVDWLRRRIAAAKDDDEAQLLRLESDARRVQIVTLHKSKGLEYPLVFLPYVGIGRSHAGPGRYCVVHDAEQGRGLYWCIDKQAPDWEQAEAAWKHEQRAEEARLLYVGLTRAKHALWIATGSFYHTERTALWPLLRDPQALTAHPGIVFDAAVPPSTVPRLTPEHAHSVPPARPAQRVLVSEWWVYSFTQLAHANAGTDSEASRRVTELPSGGQDEPALALDVIEQGVSGTEVLADSRFIGTRFGVALHEVFERTDFVAWCAWRADAPVPVTERAVLVEALRGSGYVAEDVDAGVALLTPLVGHTLTSVLPEGVRLCDVPVTERRPEIEFQFVMRPTVVDALLTLLHEHGLVRQRQGFGMRRRLEGLMTGMIDLIYRHAGRWYVLDYKSNRLPGYTPAHLAAAMADSEYDLQALIYTVALHRWLRFRLGDGYNYACDMGGIRYLFCRGVDAARTDAVGVHAQSFAPALIAAVDAMFSGACP